MGILYYVIAKMVYPVIIFGGATVFAFRLGHELPIASRRAGRSIGMGYNYFKVTLKVHCLDLMHLISSSLLNQNRQTT